MKQYSEQAKKYIGQNGTLFHTGPFMEFVVHPEGDSEIIEVGADFVSCRDESYTYMLPLAAFGIRLKRS